MHKKVPQRGLTLLELILSLTILSVAFTGINALSERLSQDTKDSLVAANMSTFGNAVKAYVKANQSVITSTLISDPTKIVLIDVNTLIVNGHLSLDQSQQIGTSNNYTFTNGYRQNLCALVINQGGGLLEALVVAEGGDAIDVLSLGGIAALIGGAGGTYWATVAGGITTNAIKGSLGGWQINPDNYHNKINNVGQDCSRVPGTVQVVSGRPFMALWFDSNSGLPLVRNNVGVGATALNTMETPLILGNGAVGVSGAACTKGAIARNTLGALLYCDSSLLWKEITATYWRDPVSTVADLPNLPNSGNRTGDIRVTTGETYNAPYMWTGSGWQTLTANKDGTLNVNALDVNGGISNRGNITSDGDITSRNLTTKGNISGSSLSSSGNITSNGKIQGQSIAASGAIIGSSLTLNATGVPEVLSDGTMKLGSVLLGDACLNNGALARDSSNGMVVYCGVNRLNTLLSWKSVVLQGTFCGMTGLLADEHIACDGLDIRDNTDSTGSGFGCPPGYYKRNIAYIGNNTPTMRTCVKQY